MSDFIKKGADLAMNSKYDKAAVRKVTLLQFALMAALLVFAFVLYYFLTVRPSGQWIGLFPLDLQLSTWLWLIPGCTIPLLIFYVFLKLVPSMDSIYDENVKIVAELYSLTFMVGYFIVNAFIEELLFRGALQYALGILPTVVLFTAAHVSYYKKPLMLVEVFVLGLFLSVLYELCQSLWLCTVAHAFYNWMVMWLIKIERIDYQPKQQQHNL